MKQTLCRCWIYQIKTCIIKSPAIIHSFTFNLIYYIQYNEITNVKNKVSFFFVLTIIFHEMVSLNWINN